MTLKLLLSSVLLLAGVLLGSLAPTLVAGAAPAPEPTTTLFSPPLVPGGKNVLDCYLVNVSDKTRAVKITALTKEGVVVATFDGKLKPGQENVAKIDASKSPRYCKFVVEGTRSDFRASILVVQEGVGSISALSAE
jgi:hypothetical protein